MDEIRFIGKDGQLQNDKDLDKAIAESVKKSKKKKKKDNGEPNNESPRTEV